MARGVTVHVITHLCAQTCFRYAKAQRDVLFCWDSHTPPTGQESIPVWCDAHMALLRQELCALVYEMGMQKVYGRSVATWLTAHDTLSAWWYSLLFEKHPQTIPELYTLFKLRALEELVQKQAPAWTHMVVHGGDARLLRTLREFCALSGKIFVHKKGTFSRTSPTLKTRLLAMVPPIGMALLRFAHWLWTVRRHMPPIKGQAPQKMGVTMVSYFPPIQWPSAQEGRFSSVYWAPLQNCMESWQKKDSSVHIHWLFMRMGTHPLKTCMALRAKFRQQQKGMSFLYVEEFLPLKSLARACFRHLLLAYRSRMLEKSLRVHVRLGQSKMPLWHYVRDIWRESLQGWRGLERCLWREALSNYVQWAGPQRWTLFPLEQCGWERMLCHAVHEANAGPVYGAQHSTVRFTDFRYMDDARFHAQAWARTLQADKLITNGPTAHAALLTAGFSEEQLYMAEALRYMPLLAAPKKHKAYNANASLHILVVTGFFSEEVTVHMRTLGKVLEAMPDLTVHIQGHPCHDIAPYIKDFIPSKTTVSQGNLVVLARQYAGRLVVWASNSTSVAVEAALMGLPVMVQAAENAVNLSPMQDVAGIAFVRSAQEVKTALQKIQPVLMQEYFLLDADVPRWRALLHLTSQNNEDE